jgi:hypothetical protein
MSIPRNLGNFADNVNTNGKVEVTGINATGTPTSSTALLGNGTWGTVTTAPAGSTGQVQYNNAGAFGAISSGTSGQVLTSAGTGATPTWADIPASAGTITAVASGSIASGIPVQMNSDGTVSAPTVSSAPNNFTTSALVMNCNTSYSSIVYMPSLNVYVCFATDLATSYLAAKIGTPSSDGTVSWGSNIVLNSKVGDNQICAVNCSNLTNTVAIYFYSASNSNAYLYAAQISATTITIGTEVGLGIRGQRGAIAWNPTASRGLSIGLDGASSNGYATAFSISGTTVTIGSGVNLGGTYEPNVEYDATSGYFLMVYRGPYNVTIQPATVSGTTVTTYTAVGSNSYTIPASSAGMGYVASAGKVILALASTSYADLISVYINMSGSTPSFVGGATLTGSTISYPSVGVDNTNNVVEFLYKDAGTTKVVSSPVSGTTITYGTPVTTGMFSGQGVAGYTGKFPYNTAQGRMLAYATTSSSNFLIYYVTFATASTSLTSANYIGVSNSSYTNGQTASITTLGGKATSLTGITAGSIMYASGTSYTTTNTGIVAGRGLSSTSMLVSYS